jgi:hypothetical protein
MDATSDKGCASFKGTSTALCMLIRAKSSADLSNVQSPIKPMSNYNSMVIFYTAGMFTWSDKLNRKIGDIHLQ